MIRPWAAEVPVDAALAQALVERQFPSLSPARAELLGQGWDNTAFAVNGSWVFRFPRRKAAVPMIEAELRVLPRIAGRLPLPVPLPELRGAAGADFPWPFAGHRLLQGVTADRAAPGPELRLAAAGLLGRFLRALHGIAPEDVPADTIGRLDAQRLRAEIRRRLGRAPSFVDDPVRAPRADTLVHGDLHARQLLFEGGALGGVIDWGDVHRGDAAVDLAIAHAFLPPAARAAFRAAYGPIDAETWRLARLRALHVSAALAEYAKETADGPLLEEAAGAIARI
ncbi:MAG TPA: phosphotransferase [Myxococcales bacterium]|nr:phosphotransferase [Myxococcales bacterium]